MDDAQRQIITATADHVRATLAGDGSGHDWWHVYRVWQMARRLAEPAIVDSYVVELAALLHDIADWKFHAGNTAAGPRAAAAWLTSQGVAEPIKAHVCAVVRDVSFKGAGVAPPALTREGMVVQDADRLDAIGAIGIARAFAYGGFRRRALHDPDQSPQFHADFATYQQNQSSTINHFYEKLLLLKDRMHTPAARRIAAERHRFMEEFLQRFSAEWEGADV